MSLPVKFSSSISPFESKNSTPVVKIEIINSPLTVACLGLEQVGYLLTDNNVPEFGSLSNLTKQYNGITNVCGFYSFTKTPIGILKEDNFALKFTGAFYPPDYSGSKTFTFKIIGYGFARVQLGATNVFGSSPSTFQILEPRTYNTSADISISSATTLVVEYYTTKDLSESGFVLLWKSDQDTQYHPVSAGVTYPEINGSNAAVLPTQTLNYVTNVSFSGSDNEIAQASFSIPIVKPTNILNGYSYNKFLDRYEDVLDKFNKHLRKTDIIKISVGYKEDNSTNTFVQKFIGNIKSFDIDRANRNSDVIKVNCESFGAFLKDTINMNFPSKFDYWLSEFAGLDFTDIRPDGIDFVPSFDGWSLDKAVKALMIRGGIDPHLFNKNRLFLNNAESQVEGSNLIENSTPKVVLEKARNYGGPSRVFSFEQPDDEYRLKSNFGDTIFDYVNKIIEPYGWETGFDSFYDGAPYLRSRNNPTTLVASEDIGITLNGTWSGKNPNLDVISGTYQETNTAADYVEHSFTGERIDLVSVLYDTNGGVQAQVVSGLASGNPNLSEVQYMSKVGGNFSLGNRIILEFPDGNVDRIIRSTIGGSPPSLLIDLLDSLPVSGTRIRTAVASAEVRRGSTWSTATPVVTGTYVPAFYEHGLEKFIPAQRVSPLSNEPIITGTKRMFYHGVDRESIENPTLFNIGTGLTRDEHTIRVTRLSNAEAKAGTLMGFNSFFIFDKDRNLPVYTFRTDDTLASGTVLKLDVSNDGEDLRNDVIVVARRVGVEVPGGGLNNPINPNNPTRKFIVSRATDINSIFNKNAINFTGRPSQTILIEPSIGAQDRADYWAVQFLDRFRFPANQATFEALGHPLLEIGDCIFVNDANKSSIDTSNRLWIEDINTRWGQKEAFDTFSTTSFPPWESFTPKMPVSIEDFENKPIVDIRITNGGTPASPYDPYSADESGTFIEIAFDMVVSGFLKIEVWADYERFSTKIADLLNPNGDEGQKGWARETFGSNKKVTWDGVDLEGDWNDRWLIDVNELQGSKQYFAAEPINTSGVTESFAKFYLVFKVVDFAGVERTVNTLQDITPNIFIYTKRGEVITADLTMSPVFLIGTQAIKPIGFDTTDNTNKGLSMTINRTNSNIRPAQSRIEVQHYPFGHQSNDLVPDVRRIRRGIQSNFEFNTTAEFIDYTNFEQFLQPSSSLNLDWDDWVRNFVTARTKTNVWMCHYFIIKVLLTDKSGRTIKLRSAHFWEPIAGTDLISTETPSFVRLSAGLNNFEDGDATSGIKLGPIWGVDVVT